MRTKEYLALVRERDGALTLTTMLFADEVRPTKDVDAAAGKTHKPTAKQLDAAVSVIEALSVRLGARQVQGPLPRAAEEVVERKRKGETIKAPRTPRRAGPAPDLMAALERTLAEISG